MGDNKHNGLMKRTQSKKASHRKQTAQGWVTMAHDAAQTCLWNNWSRIYSVATITTDVFRKIEFWMLRKLAKTVRIFVEIEHIENRGVTFWPEKIGPVFLMLWSSHEFSHGFATELVTASWCGKYRSDSFRSKCDPPVFNVFYLHKYSHGFI